MNTLIVLMIVLIITQIALFAIMFFQIKKFMHFKNHVTKLFLCYEESILDYWKKVNAVEAKITGEKPKDLTPRMIRGRTHMQYCKAQ